MFSHHAVLWWVRFQQSRLLPFATSAALLLQRGPFLKTWDALQRALIPAFAQVSKLAAPLTVFFGGMHAATGASVNIVPVQGSTNPAKGKVGVAFSWVCDTAGNTSADSYKVEGDMPPGVNWSGRVTRGVTNLTGTPTEAGTFKVVITGYDDPGLKGKATNPYELTIIIEPNANLVPPPVIATQPKGGSFLLGEAVTLKVEATGAALKYQWRKDEKDLANATGPELAIAKLTAADAGAYRVVVSNAAGSKTSDEAVIEVRSEFQAWTAKHWAASSELGDDKVVGRNANPDGDAWNNLMEFALGGDPKAVDPARWPVVGRLTDKGVNYVTITMPKPTSASVALTFQRASLKGKVEWLPVVHGQAGVVIVEDAKQITLRFPRTEPTAMIRAAVDLK